MVYQYSIESLFSINRNFSAYKWSLWIIVHITMFGKCMAKAKRLCYLT